jgi:hypothetical protein
MFVPAEGGGWEGGREERVEEGYGGCKVLINERDDKIQQNATQRQRCPRKSKMGVRDLRTVRTLHLDALPYSVRAAWDRNSVSLTLHGGFSGHDELYSFPSDLSDVDLRGKG